MAASAVSAPKHLTGDAQAVSSFLAKFDTFLFDCDGVLWSGENVFANVPETIEFLRSQGKRLVFVTNNSTKSRQAYKAKFDGLNIPVTVDEIFGSAYSAAIYISRILDQPQKKTFVLGESGIEQELASEGIPYVGGTDPSFQRDITPADFRTLASGEALDPDVGIVLSGLDHKFNYLKLATAFQYLQRGATFLATNIDSTLPSAGGLFIGAGSVGAPLVKASGKEPLSLGKPSQAMLDAVEGRFSLDRAKTCMVGDRLNTDIKFGINGKLGGTLHVLTGVSSKDDWETESVWPSAYVDKLSDLLLAKQN